MTNVIEHFIMRWFQCHLKFRFYLRKKKQENVEETKVFKISEMTVEEKPSSLAMLKVVNGKNAGQIINLDISGAFIGRKANCKIYIPDPNLSRYHAFIGWENKKLYLEDRGSTNGTYVNGQLIKKKKVS